MSFWKKTPKPDVAKVHESKETPEAKGWTNGSALGSKGFSILIVVAIACGPVALGVASLNGGSSSAAPGAVQSKPPTALQQSAGSFAIGFVGAWLGATQDDSSALSSYSNVNVPQLSKTAYQYRNAAVASVVAGQSDDVVQVVVAADVRDDTVGAGKGDQWPRRYFQVIISESGSKLVPVGLPAAVAGPEHSTDAPQLGYNESIATSSAAGKTVTAFLGAYLTGQGATEPYTSPSTSIPGIDPAPYSDITISSIQAANTPAEHPSDGTTVQVYAMATLANSVGQQVTSTYTLNLRARADRWEVAALGTTPTLSNSASTPQPSPSGGSNKEGN